MLPLVLLAVGFLVLEAVGLTASTTAALCAYTLQSKRDFSYLGAGLSSALWVLIFGGLNDKNHLLDDVTSVTLIS